MKRLMMVGDIIREYNQSGNYRSLKKDSPEGARLLRAAENNPDRWGWMTAKANDTDIENSAVISAVNRIQNEASEYDKYTEQQRLKQIKIRAEDNKPRRMAGEDKLIQDAIKHIEEGDVALDSAMQDAEEYLTMRRPELDQFRKDGQSYGDVEADLLALDTLRGNVPAPVVRRYGPGEEDRLHTRYQTNQVTGQQEVAPFMDTETGNVLVTELGKLDIKPHTKGGRDDTASELVGLNILKLMDEEPASMNRVGNNHHYADAKLGSKNVEMMIADRGRDRFGNDLGKTNAVPMYTNVVPTGNVPDEQVPAVVKKAFDAARRRNGGSTEKAYQELIATGQIKDNGQYGIGKILRSDINNVGGDADAVYDSLLISGYDRKLTKEDKDFRSDTMAVAPTSIHMIEDLGALREGLRKGQLEAPAFVPPRPNYGGGGGGGHARAKIMEVIPTGSKHVKNLAYTHPLTQQLLQTLPVI